MRKQMQEEARNLINTLLSEEEVFTSGFITDLLAEDKTHTRTEWNNAVWAVIERGKRLGFLEADKSKSPIEFTKKKNIKFQKRKAKKAISKANAEPKLDDLQVGKAILALIDDLKEQVQVLEEEKNSACEDLQNCLREKVKLERENFALNQKLIRRSSNGNGLPVNELEKYGVHREV